MTALNQAKQVIPRGMLRGIKRRLRNSKIKGIEYGDLQTWKMKLKVDVQLTSKQYYIPGIRIFILFCI